MINFVVPSLGRKTLKNTLQSLIDQTNPNWKCWVGFDGLSIKEIESDILIDDERINYIEIKPKLGIAGHHGNAGKVRNYIIDQIDNDYEWIGFVDDDDSIRPYYIDSLIKEIEENTFDCCVFRMKLNENIIPPMHFKNQIIQNFVGISFCVKKEFIDKNNIKFINYNAEDFNYLEQINNSSGEIIISDSITYDVNI